MCLYFSRKCLLLRALICYCFFYIKNRRCFPRSMKKKKLKTTLEAVNGSNQKLVQFFFLCSVIPNLNGVAPATVNKKGSFYEGRTMDSTVGFYFRYHI